MKKITLIIFIVVLTIMVASCQYDIYGIFKENVRWVSDSDVISFSIQGPNSEKVGFGTIKIDDELFDVLFVFESGNTMLGVYTLNMWEEQSSVDSTCLIIFHTNIMDSTTIELEVIGNNTGDPFYDDLIINIYRENLEENELDARVYLGIRFTNDIHGIQFEQTYQTAFRHIAYGNITIDNINTPIKFLYIDDTNYEVFDLIYDVNLFSGTYISKYDSLILNIDDDHYFNSSVESITLSAY